MVELREPDRHLTQLLGAEVARLRIQLLHVVRTALHARGGVLRRETFGVVNLTFADPRDVAREDADDARNRARARVARALEERLRGPEDRPDVARAPRVGQR